MKIIVNGKFLAQRITGVQRFAREILSELDKICSDLDIELAVPMDVDNLPHYNNIKIVQVGRFKGNLWEQISFPRYVKKQKGISLNLCNSAPLRGKKIITIHDMKIKAHPEFFSKKFLIWYKVLFKNLIKKSEKIITVSEFSKNEILKYYNCDENKIFVINNAWQHFNNIDFDEKALNKFDLHKFEYYFAMSSLEPNKNLKWIIEVAKRNKENVFVVAGGLNEKVFSENQIVLPPNVKLLGYISDSEAKTLMRDCKAFLFPTIYEGFGIPPLEAISCGAKNIIVSDTEVMHEIFEDMAIFINPQNFNYDVNTLYNMRYNSQKILDKYSWECSSHNLFKLLLSV